MEGTVAITDHGWYEFLLQQKKLEEVNFWTPSAHWGFRAEEYSPFFFKLKARYKHAICGFGFFARFVRLPDWLAWDWFGVRNGCATLEVMQERIGRIRKRIEFQGTRPSSEIGCILVVQPVFFPPDTWVDGPRDWPIANLRHKKYDLTTGEGLRVWQECVSKAGKGIALNLRNESLILRDEGSRYGAPQLIQPRLGQGTFRAWVMDAYHRACAVTNEHSLPALEASHIRPYAKDGPHDVKNGVLLRADLHRLFDLGYLTITTKHRLEVSPRLKIDYHNGRTYYPLHGTSIALPSHRGEYPSPDFIMWHNEKVYLS